VQDLKVEELIDGVVPQFITIDLNHMLTSLPSSEEIFHVLR